MKIASIDIGTNAIKYKIFSTTPASIKFVQGMRSPIRLGSEVFEEGQLSKIKLNQVIETIQGYEEIFKSNEITHMKSSRPQHSETRQILKRREDILRPLFITHCALYLV